MEQARFRNVRFGRKKQNSGNREHALNRIHTKRSIGKLSMNSEINMVYLGKNFRHRKNWKPTENEAAVELSTL